MRKSLRNVVLGSVLLLGTSLVFASPALADCEGMREFTGLLQGMKKGEKGGFVVDNRQGDKVKFIRDATSTVVDESGGAKKKENGTTSRTATTSPSAGSSRTTRARPTRCR